MINIEVYDKLRKAHPYRCTLILPPHTENHVRTLWKDFLKSVIWYHGYSEVEIYFVSRVEDPYVKFLITKDGIKEDGTY